MKGENRQREICQRIFPDDEADDEEDEDEEEEKGPQLMGELKKIIGGGAEGLMQKLMELIKKFKGEHEEERSRSRRPRSRRRRTDG